MTDDKDGIGTMGKSLQTLGVLGICVTLSAAVPLLPSVATAQTEEESDQESDSDEELSAEEKKKFQTLVKKGKKAFSVDEYETALERFEKAYQIKKTPNLLFNMGLVAEQAGKLELALEHYEEYVVSPGVKLELRKKAQDRIEALRPIVEDQKSDDEKKAESDEADDESADDKSGEKEGSAPDELADAEGEGDETDEGSANEGGSSLAGPIALVGGGAALIGGGVVFTLLSQSAADEVQTGASPEDRREAQQAAYRNQWIADGLLVGGIGAATAGAILWANAASGSGSGGAEKASIAPTLGPGFAGLRLQTHF